MFADGASLLLCVGYTCFVFAVLLCAYLLRPSKHEAGIHAAIRDTYVLHMAGCSVAFACAYTMRHLATLVETDTGDKHRASAIHEIASIWQGAEMVVLMDVVYTLIVVLGFGMAYISRGTVPSRIMFKISRAGLVCILITMLFLPASIGLVASQLDPRSWPD